MPKSKVASAVSGGIRSVGVLGAVVMGLCVGAATVIAQDRPAMPRSGIEMQLFDSRIPADEQRVLDSTLGYALPALTPGAAWVGEEAIDLDTLRGNVLVIQSFTRADSDGRAAMRRTSDIVANLRLDGVRVIGLHTPDEAEAAAAFFEKRPPSESVIIDRTGAYCDELGVYKRPLIILIDRQGRIRYPGVAMSKLAAAVEILAAEKIVASAKAPDPLPPRADRIDEEGQGAGANDAALPPFPTSKSPVGQATDVRGRPGPSLTHLDYVRGEAPQPGRVVMVEFWATWCPPCVKNIPHLNELHERFGDSVAIIGVSDEPIEKVRPFAKSRKMQYAVALDEKRVLNDGLGVRAIPHAIVMSPDGIVRWQGHPGGLSADTLQQIVDASGVKAGSTAPKRWVTAE